MFVLLKKLLQADPQDYFNWLAKLLLKIFVVKFLSEVETLVKDCTPRAIEQLRRTTLILKKYIKAEEEKMLLINSLFWINEIMIEAPL